MKLSDDEILARIEQEEANAYGINDSELAAERAKAIEYYLGRPYGNEVEGRSQVVTTEVMDTVENALAQLLKVFVSGDQVVRFDPRGPEDQEASEQETEFCSYILEKNQPFKLFYVWIKDCLLSKNGYVRADYYESTETETETYAGLTDAQLQMLASDPNVSIVEHMMQQDPMTGETLHHVKVEVANTRSGIKIANVPPENMRIGVDTPSVNMQEANFVQHSEMKTPDELREQGFNVPDNITSDSDFWDDEESLARDLYGEDRNEYGDKVLVRDTFIRVDGKVMRYVLVGKKVIHKEEAEIIPFACITPIIMPHRHIGLSYADLTMSDQLQCSTLTRQLFDAQYIANAPRIAVSERANLDDVLVSRPGGVIRTQGDPAGAIMPIQLPPANPATYQLLEMTHANREKRTGVTAYNQGLDADSLNKTATGINIIQNAAQERLAAVARCIAETGVRDLFMLIHRLVRTNYTKPEVVRLRNQWVEVDPRSWKNRFDASISVGLGTGNKDQQLAHLMTILQVQREGLAIGITTPENIYNAVAKLTQNAGFKNPEEFWTNPAQQPPQPPQPSPEEIKMQGQMQIEQMKLQADQQKFQAETVLKQQEAEKQLQQEMLRSQNDVAIEQEKIRAQMELERYKAELDAQTELQKAQLQIEAQKEIAVIEAQIKAQEMEVQAQIESQKYEREAELRERDSERQMQMHQEKIAAETRQRRVVRDANGRVEGIE